MVTFPVASHTTGAPLGCMPKVMVAPAGTLMLVYLKHTTQRVASYTPFPVPGVVSASPGIARLRSTITLPAGLKAPSEPSDPLSHCPHAWDAPKTENITKMPKKRVDMEDSPFS